MRKWMMVLFLLGLISCKMETPAEKKERVKNNLSVILDKLDIPQVKIGNDNIPTIHKSGKLYGYEIEDTTFPYDGIVIRIAYRTGLVGQKPPAYYDSVLKGLSEMVQYLDKNKLCYGVGSGQIINLGRWDRITTTVKLPVPKSVQKKEKSSPKDKNTKAQAAGK